MLVIAALAVLLAGDTPVAQILPSAPAHPTSLAFSAGWSSVRQVDPYGRAGVTTFTNGAPLLTAALRGERWYAELAGQLMFSSITNRNVTASVRRDLLGTGSLRWSLGLEVADVRFRRDDFRTEDVLIGTNRTATIGMLGVGFGFGPYRGASARVIALGGWYRNRYGSIMELPTFSGEEPLADDENPVVGAKAEVLGITVADRIELGGSVRYLRLSGGHAPSVPSDEVSGTASVDVRLFRIRGKSLFVGGFARFGPSGPSIITDKTFGLRGTWRLRK